MALWWLWLWLMASRALPAEAAAAAAACELATMLPPAILAAPAAAAAAAACALTPAIARIAAGLTSVAVSLSPRLDGCRQASVWLMISPMAADTGSKGAGASNGLISDGASRDDDDDEPEPESEAPPATGEEAGDEEPAIALIAKAVPRAPAMPTPGVGGAPMGELKQ